MAAVGSEREEEEEEDENRNVGRTAQEIPTYGLSLFSG